MEKIDLSSADGATEGLDRVDRLIGEELLRRLTEAERAFATRNLECSEAEERVRQRADQVQLLSERETSLRDEVVTVVEMLQQARTQLNDLVYAHSRLLQELETYTRQVVRFTRDIGAINTRTSVERQGAARLLTGLGDRIEPGSLEIAIHEQQLRWITTPLRIRDGFGGYLPRDYGRFRITLCLAVYQHSVGLSVEVEALDSTRPFPHPHVSGSNPCLGTGREVVLASLVAYDYATAIATMMEFLEDYCDDNPFKVLSEFGDLNRWSIPTCRSGRHIVSDCTCPRCVVCCRHDSGDSGDSGDTNTSVFVQDCGACSTCCAHHHYQLIDAPADSGFPGSTCAIKGT